MSERINWVNFVSLREKIKGDVFQKEDIAPQSYPKDLRCEANVILRSRRLNLWHSLVSAEFSCQRCELPESSYCISSESPEDPVDEIKEAVEVTTAFLKQNCSKLKEQFNPEEISVDMLPPILGEL